MTDVRRVFWCNVQSKGQPRVCDDDHLRMPGWTPRPKHVYMQQIMFFSMFPRIFLVKQKYRHLRVIVHIRIEVSSYSEDCPGHLSDLYGDCHSPSNAQPLSPPTLFLFARYDVGFYISPSGVQAPSLPEAWVCVQSFHAWRTPFM